MKQTLQQAINLYAESLLYIKSASAFLEQLKNDYKEALEFTDNDLSTDQAEKIYAAYKKIEDHNDKLQQKYAEKDKASERIKEYILAAGKEKSIYGQVRHTHSYVTYIFSLKGENIVSDRD